MVFPVVTKDKVNSGDPQSIMEVLQGQAILDYRGESDLIIKDDDYYLRGYSSSRFTTAYDGMVVRKTGGRQASDIVDYAFIPPWLVEKTEIIPGPQLCTVPGKFQRGRAEFCYQGTQNILNPLNQILTFPLHTGHTIHRITMPISAEAYHISPMTLDTSIIQQTGTLRHTETDVQNLFGRLGYALSNGGLRCPERF